MLFEQFERVAEHPHRTWLTVLCIFQKQSTVLQVNVSPVQAGQLSNMGRDGIEPSTSGLKDARLPLQGSKRHIGTQTKSLNSEADNVINAASRRPPL
jgi:hypothetical protein